MKQYIIPYIASGDGWWFSADLYNSSDSELESATILCQNLSGRIVDSITVLIEPLGHYIIPSSFVREIRATILISCWNDILITPFQGYKLTGIATLKIYNNNLIEKQVEKWKEYWNNKFELSRPTIRGGIPVQEYITPNDPVIIKDINENIRKWIVTDPMHCERNIIEIYRHTRNKSINPYRYRTDIKNVGLKEYWMKPDELRTRRAGDCEDWAIEMISYYIAAGVPNWRLRLAVGQSAVGGHATVYVLRDDMKTWVLTDSTSFIGKTQISLDLKKFTPIYTDDPSMTSLTKVWYCFNNEFVWKDL